MLNSLLADQTEARGEERQGPNEFGRLSQAHQAWTDFFGRLAKQKRNIHVHISLDASHDIRETTIDKFNHDQSLWISRKT